MEHPVASWELSVSETCSMWFHGVGEGGGISKNHPENTYFWLHDHIWQRRQGGKEISQRVFGPPPSPTLCPSSPVALTTPLPPPPSILRPYPITSPKLFGTPW
ncbi:unnamed protein product [Gadus morhua 'NCC']